uniref:glycogenin glucosyltransferase n=1 Tax=Seriola dumerili TaxID=41447 RepID=A0A3B4TN20_SERDU
MADQAFVTLATNDNYARGAMVLGKSLRNHNTSKKLVVLIGPQVSEPCQSVLKRIYDEVREVDVLDSGDTAHLAMMKRPDLGCTFTKLHCWTLTHYSKCVFMDADTLVLSNIDELFDREELSAAPDPGWPDCFNSGVFVFHPSMETYDKLLQYCTEHGSFDDAAGSCFQPETSNIHCTLPAQHKTTESQRGDQGVLNGFFSNWATADISKHLPFIYNLSSIAIYTYLPAFKQYGGNAKVVHFLGKTKPWSYTFDPKAKQITGTVHEATTHPNFLLDWWTLYSSAVVPMLHEQYGDQPFHSGCVEVVAQVESFSSHEQVPEPQLSSEQRKEKWEQGQADYMGMDSFDNIKKKLDTFLK